LLPKGEGFPGKCGERAETAAKTGSQQQAVPVRQAAVQGHTREKTQNQASQAIGGKGCPRKPGCVGLQPQPQGVPAKTSGAAAEENEKEWSHHE
jgi:hypothetical protein